MGFLWDLVQQSQISEQKTKAESIEQKVANLESELHDTRVLLHNLIKTLEIHLGKDIDGDGRVG